MKCVYCHEPIGRVFISSGMGEMHRKCYHRCCPPEPAETLVDVLRGGQPLLATDAVCQEVFGDIERRIIRRYNTLVHEQWKRLAEYD